MRAANLAFPVVGKPDMGCRGAGVKLLGDERDLAQYLSYYPAGSCFMLQRLADWEPEAGVFYVKYPGEDRGCLTSMAFKYTPYVVGDGSSTLRELLQADARAKQVMHLYEERHRQNYDKVIPKGEPYRLIFAASHCRGAVFTDACDYITDALTDTVENIMSGFPEFYYGRLDIKFRDLASLQQGQDIAVVEINGASSESLHIWDKSARLTQAWKVLVEQYRTLFRIGAAKPRSWASAAGFDQPVACLASRA